MLKKKTKRRYVKNAQIKSCFLYETHIVCIITFCYYKSRKFENAFKNRMQRTAPSRHNMTASIYDVAKRAEFYLNRFQDFE